MSSTDNSLHYLFADKMCTLEEYYDIDSEKCIPCSECSTEDSVLMKCSYFADTLCKTDLLKGFALLSNPAPQSSQVSRGSGTVAVEVLPDDWTSNINPTVLMVSGCLCIVSLVVVVFLISFRLWKKYWRPRKEKVIYLTRCKIFKINLSKFSCSLYFFISNKGALSRIDGLCL